MSQALEESRRMYEEQNRHAPPDERLEVNDLYGNNSLRLITFLSYNITVHNVKVSLLCNIPYVTF